MKWWDRWPGRLEAEEESFNRSGLDFARDEAAFAEGRFVLHGTIEVDDERVDLDVQYPDRYPWTRFTVAAPNLELPRHQHPLAKNLCVFPRNSVHWDRRYLAGDIVAERVPELIRLVRAGGSVLHEAEDPQGEPYSTYFTYWPLGGILIPDEVASRAVGIDGGQLMIRMLDDSRWIDVLGAMSSFDDPHSLGVGVAIELRRGTEHLAHVDADTWAAFAGPTFTVNWARVEPPPVLADPGKVTSYLIEKHDAVRKALVANDKRTHIFGIVFEEEIRHGEFGDAWMFPFTRAEPSAPSTKRTTPKKARTAAHLLRGMQVGRVVLTERIPELAPMSGSTVAVIGLGTLGAPFAKEMVRGLIREIRIVDFDHVDAATAVRWELGASVAGADKALTIGARLRTDFPYTKVVPIQWMVGGTEGEADDWLSQTSTHGADLIVDATAEDNVTAAVAEHAWESGTPFLTFWSIEGIGGVVARLAPGKTGCYHCLELAISPDGGSIAVPDAPASLPRVQPRSCADPTFTAAAADLTPLVSQAARLAYGELCGGVEGGYPRSAYDVHVLWLREPDGTLIEPVRWTAHLLPVDPTCPLHAGA